MHMKHESFNTQLHKGMTTLYSVGSNTKASSHLHRYSYGYSIHTGPPKIPKIPPKNRTQGQVNNITITDQCIVYR